MSYLNICTTEGSGGTKNTGFKNPDCLETLLDLPVLSNGFAFPNVAGFETVAQWKTAIQSKAIVPLFDVFEVADASTEDTKFESGNFSKVTEKGVEKVTFECYLSHCAYEALKSFEDSNYTELFEFNQGGDYSGIFDADGERVRGRKIKSISVTRKRATKEKVPYVTGEIVFEDKDDTLSLGAVVTTSDLAKDDLDGIYDVNLAQSAATTTSIKVKATSGCAGNEHVNSLTAADFVVKDANGSVQTVGFVAPNSDNEYEFTGTGFASGFTVEVNGVIAQTDIFYEGVEPLTVNI